MKMSKALTWGIVAVAGAGTIAFLWHEHAAQAAPGVGAASPSSATTPKSVHKPKPKAPITSANSPVTDVSPSGAEEPFTQLQLESAGALGEGNPSAQDTAAGDDAVSMPLNEDLSYLGIGG